MAIEKIKILGAVLELPAKQHCSKMAPRIWTFSIVIGADYSFELISIETYAPQFIGHNIFFPRQCDLCTNVLTKVVEGLGSL